MGGCAGQATSQPANPPTICPQAEIALINLSRFIDFQQLALKDLKSLGEQKLQHLGALAKLAVTLLCKPQCPGKPTAKDYSAAADFYVDVTGQLNQVRSKLGRHNPFKPVVLDAL